MIRCYVTDRRTCPGDLLDNIERVAAQGVDMIQIREKDVEARDLLELTTAAVARVTGTQCKIIVNGRADVAIAAHAHGIHLPSDSIPPGEWKKVWPKMLVGVSCHSLKEVDIALGADYVFFSPVFETPEKGTPVGLAKLAEAAERSSVPVLALGGVTWENAEQCLRTGAAGIAAIRLFQQG